MYVDQGNLIYDSSNEACSLTLCQSQGNMFAFIQCLDVGFDGQQENVKRYWGLYSYENAEHAIREIMKWGGKWPQLPDYS